VRPDDLQSVFGEGYRLRSVSLTMTPVGFWPFDFGGPLGKPVTKKIETKIPEIISQLRERAKVMHVHKVGAPLVAELGHFSRH